MKHKFWYDEQTDVLHQQIIGDFSTAEAMTLGEYYTESFKDKPYRQLIVDLTEGTKMESRETRQISNKMLDAGGVTDVAYIGATSATRMIAKVLMKLGNLEAKSDFFKTEKEALNWLMNRRKKK
ncbi:MAG: STAS/SEC14 domain-containing protein [Bacteroidetes bacterium]|nr:STAS/SEC14 domain-containing protein [Bacteroidota bacterium]